MPIGASASCCFTANGIPGEMGAAEVESFLSWLAVAGQVSAASLVIWHGVDFNAVLPMVTPTTIALVIRPFSVYCIFIQ